MPCFVLRRSHSLVQALRSGKDTSIEVGGQRLVGMPIGWWYIIYQDGSSDSMSHGEFVERYEPANEESAQYMKEHS